MNKYNLYLAGLISESQYLEESQPDNYMFFNSLRSIKEKVDKLLSLDQKKLDAMLNDGHDWARDHISTSRDDIEEVYNWITGELNKNA